MCTLVYAQTTSSRISGTITDPHGAAVPGASITILNPVTGQTFATVTNAQGDYVVPAVPAATYRITVEAKGFRTSILNDVKVDAAVPATVNARLEVGTVNETIEVSAAAEVIQSASATVSSTLVGRQLVELPTTTRNLLELVLTQPGTQTPGTPRTSSINGLPKGSVNISIDGLNVQDNLLRSDDGFFTTVMPRTDAIEEVTISTAGVGAESAGEGAAQVKFVTKSGTNSFHGGGVWQNRNTFFNSNYYFNTIDRLPRDVINLNQDGVNLGGPFKKNRAFFFVNYEDFRLPQTYRVTAAIPNAGRAPRHLHLPGHRHPAAPPGEPVRPGARQESDAARQHPPLRDHGRPHGAGHSQQLPQAGDTRRPARCRTASPAPTNTIAATSPSRRPARTIAGS